MRVEADLDVTVNGNCFRVRGDGGTLVVEVDNPARVIDALRHVGRRPTRGNIIDLADRLSEYGLSVAVRGQRGDLLTLGAETDAGLLRFVTGSRHVAPGSARASLSLVKVPLTRGAIIACTIFVAWALVRRAAKTTRSP